MSEMSVHKRNVLVSAGIGAFVSVAVGTVLSANPAHVRDGVAAERLTVAKSLGDKASSTSGPLSDAASHFTEEFPLLTADGAKITNSNAAMPTGELRYYVPSQQEFLTETESAPDDALMRAAAGVGARSLLLGGGAGFIAYRYEEKLSAFERVKPERISA